MINQQLCKTPPEPLVTEATKTGQTQLRLPHHNKVDQLQIAPTINISGSHTRVLLDPTTNNICKVCSSTVKHLVMIGDNI